MRVCQRGCRRRHESTRHGTQCNCGQKSERGPVRPLAQVARDPLAQGSQARHRTPSVYGPHRGRHNGTYVPWHGDILYLHRMSHDMATSQHARTSHPRSNCLSSRLSHNRRRYRRVAYGYWSIQKGLELSRPFGRYDAANQRSAALLSAGGSYFFSSCATEIFQSWPRFRRTAVPMCGSPS